MIVVIDHIDQDSKAEEGQKTNDETTPAGDAEGSAEKVSEEAKPEDAGEKAASEEGKPASEAEGEEKPAEGGAQEEAAGGSEQVAEKEEGETAGDNKADGQQETEGKFKQPWYSCRYSADTTSKCKQANILASISHVT